jgi:chromosome partitioning protein
MILAIAGEKGGTGKTTIAIHMAYMRAVSGRNVLLVDTDPQGTATMFVALRNSEGRLPAIPCTQRIAPRAAPEATTLRAICGDILGLANKYDDIIVDAGGHCGAELKAALCAADRLLVPVKASQLDLWTLQRMNDLLEFLDDTSLKGRLVFTQVPTIPGLRDRKIKHAREGIASWNISRLEISGCVVHTREYYALAIEYGATVFEDVPGSSAEKERRSDIKASTEMMEVYTDFFGESHAEFARRSRAFLGLPDSPPDAGATDTSIAHEVDQVAAAVASELRQ